MGKIEDDDAMARLEAALYSAGRPLTIEELIKASGTESRTKTLALMTNLVKKTKAVFRQSRLQACQTVRTYFS